ncbi:unnamed protein product [Closterium sp. Naga37s-1]|nr:unnamed protein product [Closterium sp. Naga37s-1]
MSASRYLKHGGGADALSPGKGEVLVRVRAASINPGDWKVQSGLVPFLPRRFPATAGYDLAGNVVAVGPGVTKYTVGDAVFGRAPFFHSTPYWKLPAVHASPPPSPSSLPLLSPLVSLPWKRRGTGPACPSLSLPATKLSAEHNGSNITISGSRSNGSGKMAWVLVANASGGVGHMAVQLAKAAGAHVTATVGARNLAFARNVLGADEVFDYNSAAGKQLYPSSSSSPVPVSSLSAPTAAQVSLPSHPSITGLYDAVIDFSPSSLTVSAVDRVLRPEGRWVHVELPLSLLALGLWRRLALRPRRLCPVMMEMMENKGADLEVLGRMAEEGKVRVAEQHGTACDRME